MDNRILFPQQPVVPVGQSSELKKRFPPSAKQGVAFNQLLNHELNGVKFSNHALQRLQNRNINFSKEALDKLGSAINKAAQKGAKESLVLMDNLALVVSIKNKTVITAMDGASIKDNVFTNIDSAVIV